MFKRNKLTLYTSLVLDKKMKDFKDKLDSILKEIGGEHALIVEELGITFLGTKKEQEAWDKEVNYKAIVNLALSHKTEHMKGGE